MGAPNAQEYSLRQLGHLTSMLYPGDTWTAIGVGKFEMPLAYAAIANGGHVRARGRVAYPLVPRRALRYIRACLDARRYNCLRWASRTRTSTRTAP